MRPVPRCWYDVGSHGNILVVTLAGEFAIHTQDILPMVNMNRNLCEEHVQRFDALLFDLSRVRWMNSDGIAFPIVILVRFLRDRRNKPVGFICNGNDRVRQLFHVIQFDRIFDMFDSLPEALTAYGTGLPDF